MKNFFKLKFYFFPLFMIIFVMVLKSCFSPWAGDLTHGNLILSFASYERSVFSSDEVADFEHELIFTGPGGTHTRSISGPGTVKISLEPGNWYVSVKAAGNRPQVYPASEFPQSRMLRAMGWASVNIRAGQNNSASVRMTSAAEAGNNNQLNIIIDNMPDRSEKIILITRDIELPAASSLALIGNKTIMLVSEQNVMLYFDGGSNQPIRVFDGGTMIVGHWAMPGELIIDGSSHHGSLFRVESNSNLILDGRGIIQNAMATAVRVEGGTFSMYGGIIRGNNTPTGGAGVHVDANGTFNMYGGTIAANSTQQYGGGVYVNGSSGGVFVKSGGTIFGGGASSSSNSANPNPIPEVLRNQDVNNNPPGHAVCVIQILPSNTDYNDYWNRNSTAGPGVNLDSRRSGALGGWE